MFLGEYEVKVDPQGRIAVPAKFRDSLKAGLIFARGLDGCISAYTPEEWGRVADRMTGLSPYRRNARTMKRLTFSGAFDAELDRQGRALLPQKLRQYASIEDEVVIAGAGNLFEIWSKARWAEQEARSEEAWQMAEELDDRDDQRSS